MITYNNLPRLVGTVATYACDEGFVLGGRSERVCEIRTRQVEGGTFLVAQWNLMAPTCESKVSIRHIYHYTVFVPVRNCIHECMLLYNCIPCSMILYPPPPPPAGINAVFPPQFLVIQEDVVVFETNADGSNADLVLQCEVTGNPTPTVTWYRGEEQLNSTLYTNTNGALFIPDITEGEFASREGVVYHCEATNTLGAIGYSATIRSRDITVYYACKPLKCFIVYACMCMADLSVAD